MTRNPTDIVQINLRIRESERLKLEVAARENGTSINAEMAARLARTFRQTVLFEANQMIQDIKRDLEPLVANTHDLKLSNEATRAADELVALLLPLLGAGILDGQKGAEIKAAIDKYLVAQDVIKGEARKRFLKIGAPPS